MMDHVGLVTRSSILSNDLLVELGVGTVEYERKVSWNLGSNSVVSGSRLLALLLARPAYLHVLGATL